MSIFGSMKTAVSGMNAQANRLSTVSDNIANVNTTGYKAVSTSFSSLVLPSSGGNYNSGGVQTSVRQAVSDQGDISYTTSTTDLAISGDGFFIVQGADGTPVLTRAGDFTKDDEGNLVNAAGFGLMGYSYNSGSPAVVVNGFDGLVPVNVNQEGLTAIASTSGVFKGNLDSNAKVAPVAPATLPSDNGATGTPTTDTKKFSMVAYDTLGNKVMYDFYFTKTAVTTPPPATGTASTWEVAIFRNADAATGGTTSFPYTTAGGAVATTTLDFDSTGKITNSTGSATIVDPVTGLSIDMDLSGFTQLGAAFAGTGTPNGQAASPVKDVTIDGDGIVYAKYEDGSTKPLYRIPLANVASPDKLTLMSGNVYSANGQSGVTVTGFPQTNGLGTIKSGALEGSNVDLAGELTEMIESQRSYTANSKVFQTGSDIMDVLVNLKR
ncbi:flagellar hook protein FlgE [Rhizobium leguminosarum bv. trifolii]|uniref:flagellar hook protein FlgE n=1 Tax=Rhizobium leguminosarum TaxID=384 RepID=UPI000E2FB98E|nr:flagellar hook protein FlgE [Rhizobium leguminosarum]RFB98191.1 flagellar hook protein FlgE [Rhizobium leguminosarum bv. trifolii]